MGVSVVIETNILHDSCRDGTKLSVISQQNVVAVFELYGAPAATGMCFQTVEVCLLWFH